MSLVLPYVGKVLALKYLVNKISQDGGASASGGDRTIKLFSNNLTPNNNTVLADVTEVEISTGYAPIVLLGDNWGVSTNGAVTTATYNDYVTFNFSTETTVYGIYITNSDDELLWIERFAVAPYIYPGTSAGELRVTPTISVN